MVSRSCRPACLSCRGRGTLSEPATEALVWVICTGLGGKGSAPSPDTRLFKTSLLELVEYRLGVRPRFFHPVLRHGLADGTEFGRQFRIGFLHRDAVACHGLLVTLVFGRTGGPALLFGLGCHRQDLFLQRRIELG